MESITNVEVCHLQKRLYLLEQENKQLRMYLENMALENSILSRRQNTQARARWAFYHSRKAEILAAEPDLSWRAVKKKTDELFLSK